MTIVFEDVVETVMKLPYDQQEMLVDLIRNWHIEQRRQEIGKDAQASLAAFHDGQLQVQSAQATIAELRRALDEE